MKKGLASILTCLILSLFGGNTYSAEYLKVTLLNGETITGEHIETYEDRWFYQPPAPTVQIYELIFSIKEGGPDFKLINQLDIKETEVLKEDASEYKNYLKVNNLFFKNNLVAGSDVLTGNEGHHKHERMYGNFAWDIGSLDIWGMQYKGSGEHLEDYYIFGAEVVSPLSGKVIGQVNDQPDNAPDLSFSGNLADKVNNYLTIQVAPKFYLSIVHFIEGSITVEIGDTVEVGDTLGQVGNSGVSYLPHLHYTLYTYIPEEKRFISIPGFFSTTESTSP